MEPCLVVFARAPVEGQVKTRLFSGAPVPGLRPVSAAEAATLHRAFLRDVCSAGARAGLPRLLLYVAGAPGDPLLAELCAETGFCLRAQGEGDLGRRMDAAIAAELAAGAAAVVLVGADSPTLSAALLREAAAALSDGADLVLGPATDGGYWLVGARRRCPELFAAGVPWGTGDVLPETLARLRLLREGGARVRLLPFLYDVDTPADLRLLIAHLHLLPDDERPAATWAALAAMGLLS